MNVMRRVNVSDTGEENGDAVVVEYRWIDSLIDSCNLESPDTDLRMDNGGPYRVVNTWFNGNRTPKHNVEIPSGVREALFIGCVFEGAEREAIKFDSPSWLTEPERNSVTITGCIFRQFAQDDSSSWSAVKIDGSNGGVGYRADGFTLTGNVMSSDYHPKYVVEAKDTDGLSVVGNVLRHAHDDESAVVFADGCTGVEVVGNGGDNSVEEV